MGGPIMKNLAIYLVFQIAMVTMVHSVTVTTTTLGRTSFGSWGSHHTCHTSYVRGFQLRVEPSQDLGDDTALNGIQLMCANSEVLTSKVGIFGSWTRSQYCPGDAYVDGVSYRSEADQGAYKDDTAGNNLNLHCSDGSWLNGEGQGWGQWDTTWCGGGGKLCGLQTQVEDDQGNRGDDTSMNRISLDCCYN